MKKWIVKGLQWALKALVKEAIDEKLGRARELVAWADVEYGSKPPQRRRDQVLSRLMHEFPQAKERDLAFAIEKVIQEIH